MDRQNVAILASISIGHWFLVLSFRASIVTGLCQTNAYVEERIEERGEPGSHASNKLDTDG